MGEGGEEGRGREPWGKKAQDCKRNKHPFEDAKPYGFCRAFSVASKWLRMCKRKWEVRSGGIEV